MNMVSILADWELGSFLGALNASLQNWAAIGVAVLGILMVIVAIYKFFKGMISEGKGQTNWVMIGAMFLVGAGMAFGSGWALVHNAADFGTNTLNQLGNGQAVN